MVGTSPVEGFALRTANSHPSGFPCSIWAYHHLWHVQVQLRVEFWGGASQRYLFNCDVGQVILQESMVYYGLRMSYLWVSWGLTLHNIGFLWFTEQKQRP